MAAITIPASSRYDRIPDPDVIQGLQLIKPVAKSEIMFFNAAHVEASDVALIRQRMLRSPLLIFQFGGDAS
jgi:hypothetical protein